MFTLSIVEQLNNKKVICECSDCRKRGFNLSKSELGIFDISAVENKTVACPVCDLYKLNRADKVISVWNTMLTNEIKWNEGLFSQLHVGDMVALTDESDITDYFDGKFDSLKLGRRYNELIYKGIGSMISSMKSGIQLDIRSAFMIFYCTQCGQFVFKKDISELNSLASLTCPICSSLRQVLRKKSESAKLAGATRHKNSLMTKQLPHKLSALERIQKQAKFKNIVEDVEAKNPTMKLVGVSTEGRLSYKVACKRCGTEYILAKRTSKCECDFCKTKKFGQFGKYMQDYVGVVINGLEVIKQDLNLFECTLRCIYCNREIEAPIVDFLDELYYCDCGGLDKQFSDVFCMDCYTPLPDIKASAFLGKSKDYVCPNCGKSVNIDYSIACKQVDYGTTLKRKIKNAQGAVPARLKVTSSSDNMLIQEEKPLYKGTDGLSYYRCYCTKHNKSLLLCENEISNYNNEVTGHFHCTDMRNDIIADLNVKELKLK